MPNSRRCIELLAFPDVQLLDVTGPLQVFSTANDIASEADAPIPYELAVIARGGKIRSTAGIELSALPLPAADQPLHTLIVAGGRGVYPSCEDTGLVAWVRQRSEVADRIASVCSGAFLLATAGLLNGRRAVTHWQRCAEFARRFPTVRLEPNPIFIQDGHIWTSAGITAGIDLALALVEQDLGHPMALAVARHLVVFLKRPGGQAQFSTVLMLQSQDDRFDKLHAWIMDNLRQNLSLPVLAQHAKMSERSFSRHYRQTTGHTPARAVELLRVEAARRLLEQRVAVQTTARRCGFGSEETLRRVFQRAVGASPQAYRERFSL